MRRRLSGIKQGWKELRKQWRRFARQWKLRRGMFLGQTYTSMSDFFETFDEAPVGLDTARTLVIICPDCGKNEAHRNRCPKCGGMSWVPAGHAGGVFERMKAQRWREIIEIDEQREAVA